MVVRKGEIMLAIGIQMATSRLVTATDQYAKAAPNRCRLHMAKKEIVELCGQTEACGKTADIHETAHGMTARSRVFTAIHDVAPTLNLQINKVLP